MKAAIINTGTIPLPVSDGESKGFAAIAEPGQVLTIDLPALHVVVVGDNPSFKHDLTEALKKVAQKAIDLILFWLRNPKQEVDEGKPVIRIQLTADKSNSFRVLLGDDRTMDMEVVGGETANLLALDYIEIRQLGLAPGQGGTPD